MKRESAYGISRKSAMRKGVYENFYLVRRGSLKIGEVWVNDAAIKSAYDARGNAVCPFSITDPGTRFKATKEQAVAYLILANAYDLKTAMEWFAKIGAKLKMPANIPMIYRKSDLFTMILEEQKTKNERYEDPGYL